MNIILQTITAITWQDAVMYFVGGLLIYLAIQKKCEPALLLPMGFGAILVNLPDSGVLTRMLPGVGETTGIIEWLYQVGIEASEALPILLFIGIGAMIDFGPLLSRPVLFVFGIAAQLGILVAFGIARLCGFGLADAASVAVIGAADGPTSLLVSQILHSKYIGAIAVAAYSYMALVPVIQPAAIKLITTRRERCIRMEQGGRTVRGRTKILFPILATAAVGILAPAAVPIVGFLMFGNLLRECGVLKNLAQTAQDAFANSITLLLGLTISFSMQSESFVRADTLLVLAIGFAAFVFDTFGGVLLAKGMNLFLKEKINPMIGAAGISAFPMSTRVVQKLAQEESPGNILLMHAAGANVAGQIASGIVGGLLIQFVTASL